MNRRSLRVTPIINQHTDSIPKQAQKMHAVDEALERQYNNQMLVPDHAIIAAHWQEDSRAFRARADSARDLAYGPAERHRLDIFHATNPRGTVVFIHGGYWRARDKADFSFVAAPFVEAGLSVATINYRLCPNVRVADVIDDCRLALAWLVANGAQHNVPVDRIALSGNSAGGHLVSMLFATDWPARGVDASVIVGGAAMSGVFDLTPLLHCSMNADLRLTSKGDAHAVSPAHLQPQVAAPLYLCVGADESEAFRQQTRLLHNAWPANCPQVDEVAGCNHFTIVNHFAHTNSGAFQFIDGLFS